MAVRGATIINNATGILIQPSGGIAANVSLNGVHIDSNNGGGLRVDGTGGTGAINVAVADSSVSFNASNGINAVSGPGNATVDIMRVVVAANGLSGVQANPSRGGIASVTVGSAMIYGNNVIGSSSAVPACSATATTKSPATSRTAALHRSAPLQ